MASVWWAREIRGRPSRRARPAPRARRRAWARGHGCAWRHARARRHRACRPASARCAGTRRPAPVSRRPSRSGAGRPRRSRADARAVADRRDQAVPVGGELDPAVVVGRLGDERAAALERLQQALSLQQVDGLAHGDAGDAELALQHLQRGDLLPHRPAPVAYAPAQHGGDLQVARDAAVRIADCRPICAHEWPCCCLPCRLPPCCSLPEGRLGVKPVSTNPV